MIPLYAHFHTIDKKISDAVSKYNPTKILVGVNYTSTEKELLLHIEVDFGKKSAFAELAIDEAMEYEEFVVTMNIIIDTFATLGRTAQLDKQPCATQH